MTYDLSKAMQQAVSTAEKSGNNSGYDYKLVYPQEGTIRVRLLYNNPSGLIIRKIARHKVGGKQVNCLSNYGVNCPVCKALSDIENTKGQVPWQLKRSTKGIAYAEYIDSDYSWSGNTNIPTKGEIILLMFPWSVYVDLSRLFNSAGDKLESLVTSNVGGVFKISRWNDKGRVQYRTEIDPFDHQHRTRDTDEEYFKLIEGLPDLNERIIPSKVKDEIVNIARDTANQLTTEYLGNSVINPHVSASTAATSNYQSNNHGGTINNYPNNNQQIATQPSTSPASGTPNGAPPCFGKHNDPSINPNQCLMCPYEVQCMASTSNS